MGRRLEDGETAMAHVYIDRTEEGRISVRVMTGLRGDKTTTFDDRAEAERFAEAKMGKRNGMVVSTLDMTSDQMAEHKARKARIDALLAEMAH